MLVPHTDHIVCNALSRQNRKGMSQCCLHTFLRLLTRIKSSSTTCNRRCFTGHASLVAAAVRITTHVMACDAASTARQLSRNLRFCMKLLCMKHLTASRLFVSPARLRRYAYALRNWAAKQLQIGGMALVPVCCSKRLPILAVSHTKMLCFHRQK